MRRYKNNHHLPRSLTHNPQAMLRSFVKYHTTVGVERIFLFFDQFQYARNHRDTPGSRDPTIDLAAEYSVVQAAQQSQLETQVVLIYLLCCIRS